MISSSDCWIPCPLQQGFLTSVKDIELCFISLQLSLGNVVFFVRGQMMDIYWFKQTFTGWFAAWWGLQQGVSELGSAGKSAAGWWGGTGERVLSNRRQPQCVTHQESMNELRWGLCTHTYTHTHSPFQSSVCAHKRTHIFASTQVGNLHVYQFINTHIYMGRYERTIRNSENCLCYRCSPTCIM